MLVYEITLNLEINPGPDQVYTVTSPDVPGLITEGSTPEEIQHNVQDAISVMTAVFKKQGWELPSILHSERGKPMEQLNLVSVFV